MVAGTQMVLTRPTTGVSDTAGDVALRASQVIEQVERSQALYGQAQAVIDGMLGMADECRESDWDAYGAMPVLEEGLNRAASFIRTLPRGTAMPEPSIEPDGEVALEWLTASSRMLSISFGEGDRAAYAMIDGTQRSKGVVRVPQGELPEILRLLIHQIAG